MHVNVQLRTGQCKIIQEVLDILVQSSVNDAIQWIQSEAFLGMRIQVRAKCTIAILWLELGFLLCSGNKFFSRSDCFAAPNGFSL